MDAKGSCKCDRRVGDINSLFTSVRRQELFDFLRRELPAVYEILLREDVFHTAVRFHGRWFVRNDGLDMGASISPPLAYALVAYKIREVVSRWKGHCQGSIYADDICIVQQGVHPQSLQILQLELDKALVPLKVDWETRPSGYLDMEWTHRLGLTRFRDRGRVFKLKENVALPNATFRHSVVDQLRRIDARESKTDRFDWSCHSMSVRARLDAKELRVFRYIGLQHCEPQSKCRLCSLIAFLRASRPPKAEGGIIQIPWGPLADRGRGRRILRMLLKEWDVDGTLQVRWSFQGWCSAGVAVASKDCLDRARHSVTDENPWRGSKRVD